MTYTIEGVNVVLSIPAEEFTEIIESLESTHPESGLLEVFRQFRREEFA